MKLWACRHIMQLPPWSLWNERASGTENKSGIGSPYFVGLSAVPILKLKFVASDELIEIIINTNDDRTDFTIIIKINWNMNHSCSWNARFIAIVPTIWIFHKQHSLMWSSI